MRYPEERAAYFAGGTEHICGDGVRALYRLKESGVYFREIVIDTGRGGETVEIDQITDVHFNYCNERDRENEELALTLQNRKWLANAASVKGVQAAMAFAEFADQVVITGDTLDYLSEGAMELTEQYIWDPYPDTMICLGGHELVRQMQTGVPDQTSLESRLEILEKFWRHDMVYESRVIGGKALCIALDNSRGCYTDSQYNRLSADIEKARREHLAVLLFQHEPVDTGGPEDEACPTLWECDGKMQNFRRAIGSPTRNDDEATCRVYNLIRENGDVIRGVFCGHWHSAYYAEIDAGEYRIPQYVLEGNPYNSQAGHVLRILVR